MLVPKYMNNFKCIGGACEDNCCIGWDVDIDKTTFKKYQNVTHPLMQRELKRYVKVNPDVYDDSINYAFAVLTLEKHCTFLNADHLCMIHKHLGESYLSNVCSSFPRITNKIDGGIERSATPSCPEVMRLLAESSDAMTLEVIKDPSSTPIVTFDIKQNDKRFKGSLITELLAIRNACLRQFESDALPLEVQLLRLSAFIIEIVSMEKSKKLTLLKDYIETFEIESTSIKGAKSQDDNRLLRDDFLAFSEMLIMHLEHVGTDDSMRYLELSKRAIKGDVTIGYEHFQAFCKRDAHIIRNWFKNHIFKNLFPFSEGENPEEALWLLLSRYAMIKRQLIGLAGFHNHLTSEIVVEYLQILSKVIEHHKHYELSTIEILKSQRMHTKKMVHTIL